MRTSAWLLGLSSVAAKWRTAWPLSAATVVLLSLAIAEPARAECSGPLNGVFCDKLGNPYNTAVPGNPYQTSAGINVNGVGSPPALLNVTLERGGGSPHSRWVSRR